MRYWLLLIVFFGCCAGAQEMRIDITRYVGSDTGCITDSKFAIPTSDKGILFVGFSSCYNNGGDVPPSPATAGDAGNVIVGKVDSNMGLVWLKVYGGSREDVGYSACEASDGGYVVLAYSASNDRDVSGNHGVHDMWMFKVDAAGNFVWQHCYGSRGDEMPFSIKRTMDNGYILLGLSNYPGGDVPTNYNNNSSYDWFAVKTDSLGNKQWAKSLGGSGDEDPFCTILVADTGYYIVGASNSRDHECTDTSWHAPTVRTSDDCYIVHIDDSGNKMWAISYGGSGYEASQSAIWDSRDSTIAVLSYTYSNDYLVTGNLGPSGKAKVWVMKVDRFGRFLWGNCLGNDSLNQYPRSICNAEPNGYYIAGETDYKYSGLVYRVDGNGTELSKKIVTGNTTGPVPMKSQYFSSVVNIPPHLMVVGSSTSDGLEEGVNIGHCLGKGRNVIVSRWVYWPVKVQDIESAEGTLKVMPNPGRDQVLVQMPEMGGALYITNVTGKVVFSIQTAPKEMMLYTHNWESGIYLVSWQKQSIKIWQKLVIE